MSDLDNYRSRSLRSNLIMQLESHIWSTIKVYYQHMNYFGSFTKISLQNLSDPDVDPSRSLKIKCDSGIGLPICNSLLVFNSNTWPPSAPYEIEAFEI